MTFTGKSVLVTGAARGIGAAIVKAIAREGARVAVTDLDGDAALKIAEEIRSEGGDATGFKCDVGDDASVQAAAEAVTSAFGPLDILVNNAYHRLLSRGTYNSTDLNSWKTLFDVNFLGNVRTARAFLPGMIARGSGHIIDTASSLIITPNPDVSTKVPYLATKGAVLGYGYGMVYELLETGVRYSVWCPGLTDTGSEDTAMVSVRMEKARKTEDAVEILLKGMATGDFLISSEPDFEEKIVIMAQNKLNPLSIRHLV